MCQGWPQVCEPVRGDVALSGTDLLLKPSTDSGAMELRASNYTKRITFLSSCNIDIVRYYVHTRGSCNIETSIMYENGHVLSQAISSRTELVNQSGNSSDLKGFSFA